MWGKLDPAEVDSGQILALLTVKLSKMDNRLDMDLSVASRMTSRSGAETIEKIGLPPTL